MNENANRKLYFESSSIDYILPTDMIRQIISFQELRHPNTKCVNKLWKTLSEEIETKHYQTLHDTLNADSPIKYDNTSNKTWVVHRRRRHLPTVEANIGFNVSVQSIDYALKQAQSGDRILVHAGRYHVSCKLKAKNLSVIGLPVIGLHEDCKILLLNDGEIEEPLVSGYANLYLENLRFIDRDCGRAQIFVRDECKLWINKCRFHSRFSVISVAVDGSTDIKDSEFVTGECPIEIMANSKEFLIRNCVFRYCKQCITIKDEVWWDTEGGMVAIPSVRLICENNIFEGAQYPIIEDSDNMGPVYAEMTELYSLRNNQMVTDDVIANETEEDKTSVANSMHYFTDDL